MTLVVPYLGITLSDLEKRSFEQRLLVVAEGIGKCSDSVRMPYVTPLAADSGVENMLNEFFVDCIGLGNVAVVGRTPYDSEHGLRHCCGGCMCSEG